MSNEPVIERACQFHLPLHVVLIENGFVCLSTDAHTEDAPEFAVALFQEEQSALNFTEKAAILGAEVRTVYTLKDLVYFLVMFNKPYTHIAWNPQITEAGEVKVEWIDSIINILTQLPPVSKNTDEDRPAPWQYPAYVMTESGVEKKYVSINTHMPDGKSVSAVALFSSSIIADDFIKTSKLPGLTLQKVENHKQMTEIFRDWLPIYNAVAVDPVISADGKQSAICLWTESLWEKYFQ